METAREEVGGVAVLEAAVILFVRCILGDVARWTRSSGRCYKRTVYHNMVNKRGGFPEGLPGGHTGLTRQRLI